jgi:hypothetical protein
VRECRPSFVGPRFAIEFMKCSTKLRRALELSASDWLMIIQATGWFAAIEIGLRVLKLRTLLNILGNEKRNWQRGHDELCPSLERVAYCVELASRFHALYPTCLRKALVLYALAIRNGVKVRLIIGTAKAGRTLQAHAWLEHEGRVITGGPGSERYSPLCCLGNGPGDSPASQRTCLTLNQ